MVSAAVLQVFFSGLCVFFHIRGAHLQCHTGPGMGTTSTSVVFSVYVSSMKTEQQGRVSDIEVYKYEIPYVLIYHMALSVIVIFSVL